MMLPKPPDILSISRASLLLNQEPYWKPIERFVAATTFLIHNVYTPQRRRKPRESTPKNQGVKGSNLLSNNVQPSIIRCTEKRQGHGRGGQSEVKLWSKTSGFSNVGEIA